MHHRALPALLILLSAATIAATPARGAETYFVREKGSDSNDGLTAQRAFRTVQQAISVCTEPGTIVYVGPGTYSESIVIGSGGGAAAVSGTSQNPIRIVADTRGTQTLDDPGPVVIDASGQTYGVRLQNRTGWSFEGLALKGFTGYGLYGTNGGVSLRGCTIAGGDYYAVYITASDDVTISDCTFERTADSGHVVWVYPVNRSSDTSVTITRNDMSLKGGLYHSTGFHNGFSRSRNPRGISRYVYGIIVYGWGSARMGDIEISNNQISDCYLPIYTTMYNSSGETVIANNTVTGSLYSLYTYSTNAGSVRVINNIVDTCYYGLLTYNYGRSSTSVAGILEHNITYSMPGFRRSFELDIIQEDPLFTDARNGDFTLLAGSPAIDAGTAGYAPSVDIVGLSRPGDGDHNGTAEFDLGAYESDGGQRDRVRVVQWKEIGGDHND